MYVPGRRSGTLGRNFATRLLTCSVFSYFLSFLFIFWLHCKNIIHNLTLKRKKKENTEQVRSLVAKLLPSLPLRGKAHTYVYRFQQIPFPILTTANEKAGMYMYIFLSFFRQMLVFTRANKYLL